MATPLRIRRPFGVRGIDKSRPPDSIPLDATPRALNVRVRFDTIRRTPGRDILAGPAAGEDALYIGRFNLVDGTEWSFMLTETNMFRWGASLPGAPRQWHRVPGPAITGTRRFGVTSGEGYQFFSRKESGTGIYRWPGGTSAMELIPASAGTVPPAKFLQYYNDRLVAANVIDSGDKTNRMRWSAATNHTAWSGTGAGFLDIYEGIEEPITGFLALNDRIVVYRKHTIMDFIATGQLTPVFITQMRVNGTGCPYPYTIASNGQRHFFLGNDHTVWTWDGSTLQNIGDRIRAELSGLVDYTKADQYFGMIAHNRGEYWLVLTDGNVFVYDYVTDSWWRDSFPNITALGEVVDTLNSGELWSSATKTWLRESRTWDAFGDAGTTVPVLFAGRSDGATFTIDQSVGYDYFAVGSIIDRYIETPDYYFPSEQIGEGDPMATGTLQRILLLYDQTSLEKPFEVAVSLNHGVTWKTQLIDPESSLRVGASYVDFNVTGSVCRFRFRETDPNANFRYRSYVMEFVPTGDSFGT